MKTFHRILITITLVLLGGIPLCASSKAIIITEKNAIIKKNKFTAYFDTEDNFFIKNSKNKIIFQSKEMTHDFDFIDFNKDGNLDGNPPKNDSHLKVEFSHNAVKITEKEILHETLKIQR